MQEIIKKIKSSLEESKNNLEKGDYEEHDIFPGLLLILMDLLEKNSKEYATFTNEQKEVLKSTISLFENYEISHTNKAQEQINTITKYFEDISKNQDQAFNSLTTGISLNQSEERKYVEAEFAKVKFRDLIIFGILGINFLLNIALVILITLK